MPFATAPTGRSPSFPPLSLAARAARGADRPLAGARGAFAPSLLGFAAAGAGWAWRGESTSGCCHAVSQQPEHSTGTPQGHTHICRLCPWLLLRSFWFLLRGFWLLLGSTCGEGGSESTQAGASQQGHGACDTTSPLPGPPSLSSTAGTRVALAAPLRPGFGACPPVGSAWPGGCFCRSFSGAS